MADRTYAIVGGGVAGASAAESLRGAGFAGRIVIVGDEAHAPYERPPLSKELLRGERDGASTALRSPAFYEKNAIDIVSKTRVVELDVASRSVRCEDGRDILFDKLLLATGVAPRKLGVPGDRLDGVAYLRTLDDALGLGEKLARRPRVLVVGTGFIGCEVAASARQLGCEVTLVGPSPPMHRVLGTELGNLYAEHHRQHGVVLRTGVSVTEFRGDHTLEAARLSDGSSVACDVAIVGIGVVPATQWLPPQIVVSDGIETDEFCATSVSGIYAAGDVACSWRPRLRRRVRLEHFDNAESQGASAGRAMLGNAQPYDPIAFFWTDQYDLSLQYYGYAREWDHTVVRRPGRDGSLVVFYLKDDRIEAACTLNRSQDANAAKRLIGRSDIADAALADDAKPLRTL